ncbi:Crp/Fnr family transcriptional regulator [Candidatus Nitrospira bockiana]
MSTPVETTNQLLAALPSADLAVLHPHLSDITVAVGQTLFDPGDIFRDVYFPTTAVISLITVMNDGQMAEVLAIGNEGMIGIRLLYDDDEAFARAVCLGSGHLVKIDAETFWHVVKTKPAVRHVIHHYAHAFLVEVFQFAACNIVHNDSQRFARWLLRKHDQTKSTEFPLPEELIAGILAISPHRLRELLAHFQHKKLITFDTTRIRICDRAGLERVTCECYARVQAELLKIRMRIRRGAG